jgi:hypothetical protein
MNIAVSQVNWGGIGNKPGGEFKIMVFFACTLINNLYLGDFNIIHFCPTPLFSFIELLTIWYVGPSF